MTNKELEKGMFESYEADPEAGEEEADEDELAWKLRGRLTEQVKGPSPRRSSKPVQSLNLRERCLPTVDSSLSQSPRAAPSATLPRPPSAHMARKSPSRRPYDRLAFAISLGLKYAPQRSQRAVTTSPPGKITNQGDRTSQQGSQTLRWEPFSMRQVLIH
jgi:hypothetical protein